MQQYHSFMISIHPTRMSNTNLRSRCVVMTQVEMLNVSFINMKGAINIDHNNIVSALLVYPANYNAHANVHHRRGSVVS